MKNMDDLSRLTSLSQQYPGSKTPSAPINKDTVAPAPDDSGKASPDAAGYQGADQGPFACASCEHFDGTSSCEVVAGPIEPQGCCNLFSKGGA